MCVCVTPYSCLQFEPRVCAQQDASGRVCVRASTNTLCGPWQEFGSFVLVNLLWCLWDGRMDACVYACVCMHVCVCICVCACVCVCVCDGVPQVLSTRSRQRHYNHQKVIKQTVATVTTQIRATHRASLTHVASHRGGYFAEAPSKTAHMSQFNTSSV